jgi:TPR repeat protein
MMSPMFKHQKRTGARALFIGLVCVLAAVSIDQAQSQLTPLSELYPEKDELSELLPLADKGDARAQFQLGTKYLHGRRIKRDIAEGLRWLRASGDQGFIKAQLYLGNYYADVANDESAALAWLRRAADNVAERDGVIGARKAGVILSRDTSTASDAASYFKRAAERGDPQARALLGTLYLDGRGLDKSFADGLKWIEQAATDRYVLPKYVLTFIFAEGFDTRPNVQEAAARLSGVKKDRTEADASYLIGTFYHRGFWIEKEDRPILSWVLMRMGADDEAIRRYFNSQRVSSSYQWANAGRAIAWYRKAAEAGHIGALVNLGLIHFKSRDSNWDCAEGMKWTHKAADRGDAQFNLGFFYLHGPDRSVVRIGLAGENASEGVRVESVAANGAASRAGLRAGDTIINLNGKSLATYGIEDLQAVVEESAGRKIKLLVKRDGEDAAQSIDVVPESIVLACPGAQTLGLRADPAEAFRWFEKSAAGGHPSGLFFLAAAYREGKGTAPDPLKAMELYRKGAERGDWEAAQQLAHMYAGGEGVEKSKELSEEWFRKAVQLKHRAVGRN